MGTLKYAILGLLSRESMTGYDMTRAFETTLFEFWSAKHSQIYPELKALTEAGFVEYKIEVTGTVLEKKLYSLTEAGRQEFLRWETELHMPKAVPKDEFRLQLFFSDSIPPEKRVALLQEKLELHRGKLQHFRENMEKFSSVPPEKEDDFSDYLVLSGGIFREESTCRWLEQCIALCKKRMEEKK